VKGVCLGKDRTDQNWTSVGLSFGMQNLVVRRIFKVTPVRGLYFTQLLDS